MDAHRATYIYLLCSIVVACCVFGYAHRRAFTNPLVVNDDVHQQIYWMQQWQDPELFRDHDPTEYARQYVPWGVQAFYRVASYWINPVQFSKLLALILYMITAACMFGLGLRVRDAITAIVIVCVFLLFVTYMGRISGGLSRGFVYPLLVAHVYFLAGKRLGAASLVVLFESLFNPYVFLISFVTHLLYVIHILAAQPRHRIKTNVANTVHELWDTRNLLIANASVFIGAVLFVIQYVLFTSPKFGSLVWSSDIVGKVEYTALGRFQFMPVSSIFYEIIRPWIRNFGMPYGPVYPIYVGVIMMGLLVVLTYWNRKSIASSCSFGMFGYLLTASLALYLVAWALHAKLFLPRRYLEYSLTIIYSVWIAVVSVTTIERLGLKRIVFPMSVIAVAVLAALLHQNRGLVDYSRYAHFYRFLETTPKSSLIAGHPKLMDSVQTFARRKAFVSYELSHPWIQPYWNKTKKRTFDFFNAYYASDPEKIKAFARDYGIDFIVIRERDFSQDALNSGKVYFEPFGSYVRKLTKHQSSYALLNVKEFPPLYSEKGLRVIRIGSHR